MIREIRRQTGRGTKRTFALGPKYITKLLIHKQTIGP